VLYVYSKANGGPGSWGYPDDAEEMRRVLRRAVELGVNYLDTAAYYGPLVSDRLIVEALYPYPVGLIIGTKVGGWRGSDRRWTGESHPEQLKGAVEDNLSRLRLEQLHLIHFRYNGHSDAPFVDSVGAMAARGQDPAYWIEQRHARTTSYGSKDGPGCFGAESVQSG
jgi:pyridoxine 4-dehydrogenase